MTIVEVQNPFEYFTNSDGSPLDGGAIYIGKEGMNAETNPVPVFFDQAATEPASQPISTAAGRPYSGGSPKRLYVDGGYSIQVKNEQGATVYSSDRPRDLSALDPWNASGGSFPSGATKGDRYSVTVAGEVDGRWFFVGDQIVAKTDNASTSLLSGWRVYSDVLPIEAFYIASLADLKDTSSLTYSEVSAGDTVRAGDYTFEVAASGATDHDFTSAQGIKLYARPDSHGFVDVRQFGAVADGNRLTGAGTDNTNAFRKAFATPYNINLGYGTFRVTGTIQNLIENRKIKGAGRGMITSAPIGDRLYFNAPTCILATGDTPTRRVITRRKYRASASDDNDPQMAAVIENWGAGSTFLDFSIELYCDYTDDSPTNLGANWDVGFFNGCRSTVGTDHVSILGYFRKASFYWDVTDAYGIPNLLDIYGDPVPFPTAGDDDGPEYGRGSGADGCWMRSCEARGRLGRVILGADTSRTGADYYDWVTELTYDDFRGGSGTSDFRSTDCVMRAEHHSNYRMQDPIGYGVSSTLTYSNMMLEDDFAPGAQHIDCWQANSADASGPAPAARGIVLDDLRYVSREIFRTRLGQIKELYFGPRTWSESNGTPAKFYDTAGADIYSNRGDETRHVYGHLCTNEYTGVVKWENTVSSIFTQWVYDWKWTHFTDRTGRSRNPSQGFQEIPAGVSYNIPVGQLRPGGFIDLMAGGIGNNVPLQNASAKLWFDVASSPNLTDGGFLGSNVQLAAPDTTPNNQTVAEGEIAFSAWSDGTIRVKNRHAAGDIILAWKIS